LYKFFSILDSCNLFENLYNYKILIQDMNGYKSIIVFFTSFLFFIIVTMNIGKANSQNYTTDPEQSDVFLKLSELIHTTKNDIGQSVTAIKSGNNTIALNILNNVTLNLEELYNGLDVLINEPSTDEN